MNVIQLLGTIGGIYGLISLLATICRIFHKSLKQYYMKLGAEEVLNNMDEEKPTTKMGFKTREEELEDKLTAIAHELRTIRAAKKT